MENLSVGSELPRVRRACYVVAAVGAIVTAFFAAILIGTLLMGRGQPAFVYELVITLVAVIYFGGVTKQAVRAARSARNEQELPQALHYLSWSVIALIVPVGLLLLVLIWFFLRPVY